MGKRKLGKLDVYTGTGGRFYDAEIKKFKTLTPEEKEKVDRLFEEHLLKIYYNDSYGYDSSDDDRADDYISSSATYVYKEVNLDQDYNGLVMHNGEIVGVVFFLNQGRDDISCEVFYFSGKPRNSMTTGYSASHTSNYITVLRVQLVKKGEGSAPMRALPMSFTRTHSDTSI